MEAGCSNSTRNDTHRNALPRQALPLLRLDACLDVIDELGGSRSVWPLVRKALSGPSLARTDLEIDDAAYLLVAAEIVALARGHGHSEFPLETEPRPPKDLDDLQAKSLAAVERLRGPSELREELLDASLWADAERQLDDLAQRLALPLPQAPPKARRKRPVVRPGDVFQIALPDQTWAYGRVVDAHSFWIYAERKREPNQPPLGSRDYQFVASGLHQAVFRRGTCPVVGHDAWEPADPHRQPVFFSGSFRRPTVPAAPDYHERPATVKECIGLPPYWPSELPGMVDRILEGPQGPTEHGLLPILPGADGVYRRMRWEDWQECWAELGDPGGGWAPSLAIDEDDGQRYKDYYRQQPFNAGRSDDKLLTYARAYRIGLY